MTTNTTIIETIRPLVHELVLLHQGTVSVESRRPM